MQPPTAISIPSVTGLSALSCNLSQGNDDVILRVGPSPTRAQHTGTSPLTLAPHDSQQLATFIRSFASLEDVECGHIHWEPVDTRALLPVTTAGPLAYAIRSAVAEAGEHGGIPSGQDRTAPLALPKNDFLTRTAGETNQRQPDVRIVQVCAIPLSATPGATQSLANLGVVSEVVVHVTDAATVTVVGGFISAIGTNVLDLTLRWCNVPALRGLSINTLVCELGIAACTSLSSLTLTYTLIPGKSSVAHTQWQLNLAVLRNIASFDLRCLRIVVKVEEDVGCDKTWEQVKQMRWKDLAMELSRFAKLRKVEVVVVGEGSEDSEIWQEIEQRLRGAFPRGVCLVQGYFCIL